MARGEEVVERMAESAPWHSSWKVWAARRHSIVQRFHTIDRPANGRSGAIWGQTIGCWCPSRSPQRLETLKVTRRWEKNEANKVSSYSQGSRGMG